MSVQYLLDTNVVPLFLDPDTALQQRILQAQAFYLPSIVLGELYFRVHRIARTKRGRLLRARYDALALRLGILPCDATTAQNYAGVRGQLEQRGLLIPENDTWIAALALQYQLTLATRDAHFARVSGLAIDQW
jgi:tRNA(fMet)-specific endonuclease VapC